jgi:hypothetical protein
MWKRLVCAALIGAMPAGIFSLATKVGQRSQLDPKTRWHNATVANTFNDRL